MNCKCGMEYKVGDISCVRCGNLDMTKDESLQAEREYLFETVRELRAANDDLKDECKRLRDALEMHEAHMSVMQKDNCNKDWFISMMLYHLDGPMQREVQKATREALEE